MEDFEDERVRQLCEMFLSKLHLGESNEVIWAENLSKHWASLYEDLENKENEERTRIEQNAPKPLLPLNMIPRLIRFLDLHPLEVARQITLIDFQIFRKIRAREYIQKAWLKNRKFAPNVISLVENFNRMTFWVASEIVLAKDDQRLLTLHRFIEIMDVKYSTYFFS